MASTTLSNPTTTIGLSAAQKLMQKHQETRQPTIEDVPDEEDVPSQTPSSHVLESASGPSFQHTPPFPTGAPTVPKVNPADKKDRPIIDTQSEELFPGLGAAPKASTAPIWGAKNPTANGHVHGVSNGYSPTPSSLKTPAPPAPSNLRANPQSLISQVQAPLLSLPSKDILPRSQLKKPITDTLKDINKKLRTNLTMTTGESGILEFRETTNQKDAIRQQAIKELGQLIGVKKSVKIALPQSTRAHIIGKQGTTIKALQDATGARIQMPKIEIPTTPTDDDDDEMIEILIEGNTAAIHLAQKEIEKIISERCASINSKIRTIPTEFYPFIAGANDHNLNSIEQAHNVHISIPSHHVWNPQPPLQKPNPGQLPTFVPTAGHNPITITGDRAAVQAARADIEKLSQQLHQQLTFEQFMVNNSQHQFIIGKQGISPQGFFAKTGCGIMLPSDVNEDSVTVVGHPERVEAAMDYAMDLASSMNQAMFDVARHYRNAPGHARMHARNITQYLRDRNEIDKIGGRHQIHITTPMDAEGAAPWEIFYRSENSKIATRAQNEIASIILAHPPTRMTTVATDPFYHDYLRRDVTPRVLRDYGVRMVIPKGELAGEPILLVYEGESGHEPDFQISREKPDASQIESFEKGLADARHCILDIIGKQAKIGEEIIDVPRIFHEKLRRYIQSEQKQRAADQIPVRVFVSGTRVTLRGPTPAVESLSKKVHAFIAEAIEDEKERGFTLSFNFPQKHVNQLIGKGGNNIRELKDKFDVEINVSDGVVELQGPKAKAEAAKTHILSLGRHWADEVTYVIKVDPKFHRELIGAQGATINRLQTRYKVQIHFPRSLKQGKDDQSNSDALSEAGRRGPRREQEPDEVIIRGPKKGADETRDELLSLVQYMRDRSYNATVLVQARQIPSLIGQRGSGMEELRQLTGARIDIPNAKDLDNPSTLVEIQIKGAESSVAQAKKIIEEKKHIFDNTVTKTIEIDKKHHKALIGAQGSTLRNIIVEAGGADDRHEFARIVQFPRADIQGNCIKIEGNVDLVENIISKMRGIVEERESQINETLDVPVEKHRSLIGRNGETKKDLEAKFKVSIEVPRQGSGLTGIVISGLPSNVEDAKNQIQRLIDEQKGESILLPLNIHHAIVDNGQFFRKLRNDYQVKVDHGGKKIPTRLSKTVNGHTNRSSLPLITDTAECAKEAYIFSATTISNSQDEDQIPWNLRGTPENVAKVKAAISSAVEQALKETTCGHLTLPDPRTYRFVIGSGGSKVNTIRRATGCRIAVPRDQSNDEAIEIIGSADGVEKAKEMILQAVEDGLNASQHGGSGYQRG
ncbi:Bgt-5114 [Blumeria graminis f. sp. tritici]|uniref:Bgt-5114 n=2 Tax=Blumeria graminis f. sp. tritici TaxID=62690 RepID=A0A381LDA7_BLUGR|nr:hypothetical protein BGT96224_5114 [Blumeria graminis f. sp. tritici 96224]VDB88200.1 Bgt-5114 [Blumeria graminis f. sp. tritici]